MSSSQDSDIDLECDKIIKPKKLLTKFFNSITNDQAFTQPSTARIKSKKIKTDASFQQKPVSNPSNKFVRRLPIALNVIQQDSGFQKNLKFNLKKSALKSSRRQSSNCMNSSKKVQKSLKIRFFQEDSQKQEQTMQLIDGLAEQTQNISRIAMTEKSSNFKEKKIKGKDEKTKLMEKTSPIYFSHRNRTQIMKEYIKDGNRIRTNWVKGLINGYTQIDYADNGKFRGIFQQGSMVSGQLIFPNGFIYTGQFSMFTFHGIGKLRFPSGQLFQGNWVYGTLSGNGKITYQKGQIYYGEISHFKRDGEGYLYFSNGNKYVGQFFKGQITGFGQLHKDGNLTHKGFWVKGKFVGTNEDQYKRKKHQIENVNKSKPKENVGQSLQKSLKHIKQMHEAIYKSQQNQGLIIESNVQVVCINDSQSFSDEVSENKQNKSSFRLKKQVSISLKII